MDSSNYQEEVEIRNLYLGNKTPQEKLAYRYFMLQSLDASFREFDGVEGAVPVRRFTLIPTHACGGSMKATFSGCVMWKLLPKIKKSHPAFYKYVRSLPEYDQRKLILISVMRRRMDGNVDVKYEVTG